MYAPQTRLFDLPICVVDVETTGATFDYGDRVVELGIVRLEKGDVVGTFDQLVDPGRPMSGGASYITGITREMLEGQPSFCDIWPAACELMKGSIVVGHNVGFDLSFLSGECRRTGKQICEVLGDCHVLDTVRIARKQLGRGGNGLQRLAGRLGLAPSTAHRALADSQTTAQVLHKLIEPHGGWEISLERAHQLQGGENFLSKTRRGASALPAEIHEALLDGVPVKISYLDAEHRKTERAITPRFVRRLRGHLMLYAHCHARNDQRTFKIDRILSAVPIERDTLFSLPPLPTTDAEGPQIDRPVIDDQTCVSLEVETIPCEPVGHGPAVEETHLGDAVSQDSIPQSSSV